MPRPSPRSLAVALPLLASLSACTVIELDSRRSPAGVEADGLVDGHVAFGWSGETKPLRLEVLEGSSRGAVFELVVWKLFRLELGLAGIDVGVGPVDAGVGVLLYDPALPPQPPRERKPETVPAAEPAESESARIAPIEPVAPIETLEPIETVPAASPASEPVPSPGGGATVPARTN